MLAFAVNGIAVNTIHNIPNIFGEKSLPVNSWIVAYSERQFYEAVVFAMYIGTLVHHQKLTSIKIIENLYDHIRIPSRILNEFH